MWLAFARARRVGPCDLQAQSVTFRPCSMVPPFRAMMSSEVSRAFLISANVLRILMRQRSIRNRFVCVQEAARYARRSRRISHTRSWGFETARFFYPWPYQPHQCYCLNTEHPPRCHLFCFSLRRMNKRARSGWRFREGSLLTINGWRAVLSCCCFLASIGPVSLFHA